MTKARSLADFISDGSPLADGTISVSEVSGAAPLANPSFTGNVSVTGNVDGVDIATRDAVLTSTTTTANAALPKAGGAITGNVTFGDNNKAIFGAGSDLQIYHDGTNSYIKDAGTGDLFIQATDQIKFKKADGSEYHAIFADGGSVDLYYAGVEKFKTTSTGIQVTGSIANASGDLTIDAASYLMLDADGGNIVLQDNADTFGRFVSTGDNFVIQSDSTDKDIIFKGNDGGNAITALTLDMSAAGTATFNSGVTLTGTLNVDSSTTNGFLSAGSNILNFGTTSNDTLAFYANNTNHMKLKPDGEVILNETGNAEGDLRVESDSNSHMLFVDAGNNRVSIGNSNTYSMFNVISSNDNTSDWWTNSVATQYMQNTVGHTVLKMNNNNSNRSSYLVYNGNGSAQGFHIFDRQNEQSRISAYTSSVVVNEAGADADFRVESNGNDNMLFVDGGANRVGIGRDPQDNGSILQVAADATASTDLHLALRGLSNENKKLLLGFDTTANIGSITSVEAGVTHRPLHLQGSEFVWNESGSDHDFRVESNSNDHMLFVDAGINRVYVGGSTNVENAVLNVQGSKTFSADIPQNLLTVTDTTAMAAGVGGAVTFAGRYHSGGAYTAFGSIEGVKTLSNNGNYDGRIIIRSRDHGANNRQRLTMNSGEAVFNEDGVDTDFRVESDAATHAIFVEASSSYVKIGKSSDATGEKNLGVMIGCEGATSNGRIGSTSNSSSWFSKYGSDGDLIKFHKTDGTNLYNVGSISVTSSGTTYNTTSDRRLKDNIEPIADATDKLMAMKPVTHTWIANPEAPSVHGFIAQEMQEIIPEAVSGEDGGEDMMSMDYGRITPVLVAALQESTNEIKALKQRVSELEEK